MATFVACGSEDSGPGSSGAVTPVPPTKVGPAGCAYTYPVPAVTGCDGVLLTDPQWSQAREANIAAATTPSGTAGLRFESRQSIKLKSEGCLQLGQAGNDFSVSMWVKPSGFGQILSSGITPFGGAGGFSLHTSTDYGRMALVLHTNNASGAGGSMDFETPIAKNEWSHVTLAVTPRPSTSFA